MENLKLVRKVKKVSRRHDLQQQQQVAASSLFYFDDCIPNLTDEDNFNKLSDELLLKIFKYFPLNVLLQYAVVCKRWNRLMHDESLWYSYDLSNQTVNAEKLIKILNIGVRALGLGHSDIRRSTKRFYCQNGNNTLVYQLDYFLSSHLKIEYLDLTNINMELNSINILLKNCRHLKKLSLESIKLSNETFNHLALNKSLKTLNICMCEGIQVEGLIMMLSSHKFLKCLNMAWTNLSRECVVLLCQYLPLSLEKLNLSGCKLTLLDNDVKNLCNACPNLIELDLSDAQSLTSVSVEIISASLHKVKYLSFSRCYSILPSSYLLLNNLKHLMALDLFNILKEKSIENLKSFIGSLVTVNHAPPFSKIARPVTSSHKKLWNVKIN